MKNNKTIIIICLALLIALSASACGVTSVTNSTSQSGTAQNSGVNVTPVGKTDDPEIAVLDDPSDEEKETTGDFLI